MNLQEAIKIALEYENKVRDHYAKGAAAIQDPQGKKVFETLAKEEQGHVDFLNFCLDQWTKTGKVTAKDLKSVLPQGVAWIDEARKRLEKKPSKRVAESGELDLLKIALQMELETSGFYRSLVGKLPADDQALFARFLDIEDGHVAIVQAELDSVQGLGYWFDVQEFALEGG
jgi:rubrerythrin